MVGFPGVLMAHIEPLWGGGRKGSFKNLSSSRIQHKGNMWLGVGLIYLFLFCVSLAPNIYCGCQFELNE